MKLQGDTSGVFSKMTFLSSRLRDEYQFIRKARAEEKLINISIRGDAPSEAPAVRLAKAGNTGRALSWKNLPWQLN